MAFVALGCKKKRQKKLGGDSFVGSFTVTGLLGSRSCARVSAARVLGWVSGECGRQGKTLTEGGSCVGLAGAPPARAM